jgi:hypothetical protein
VSVSNAEVAGGDGQIVPLADVVVTDQSAYSEWLELQRSIYDGPVTDQKTDFDYWDRAFGGPVAFEDMWMDVSRLGETFEIGPTYVPNDYTENDDRGRIWYFGIDNSKVPTGLAQALKFELTVDGETKTIAFQL